MALTWVAIYQNGDVVTQFDENRKERSTAHLSRDGLSTFALVTKSGLPLLVQHFDDGMRFIFRRRVTLKQNDKQSVCYLVGWQKVVGDQTIQHISCVHEHDYHIETIGNWRENHQLFDSIVEEDFDRKEIKLQ